MIRKQILIFAFICILMISSAVTASGASNTFPDDMAVHINGNFSGQSALIQGSLYSANGNIQFNNAGDNEVTGSIYHKTGTSFIIPQYYNPDFKNRVETLESTQFNESFPEIIDAPDLANRVESLILNNNSPVLTISESTHYGKLTVGQNIIIDTSNKDIYLVVDTLACNSGFSITLQGDGRLFLFIDQFKASAGPLKIENGQDPFSTYIVSETSLSNDSMDLYAHVFYTGIPSVTMRGKLTGTLVTDAAYLEISNSYSVNGLVYAPAAAVTVQGSGKITGRLVANSLNMSGRGQITYRDAYAFLSIPDQLKYFTVDVRTNIAAGGTVSPSSTRVRYGEVVKISAVPNEGYRFAGFTSSDSSMIPDSEGNLTVTGPVNIMANFAVISGEYVNGLLGEYYDARDFSNDSALRMRRIDSNIAHNFMYDPPATVIERNTFSIRWTGYICPTVSGNYTFKTLSDDGVAVTVNGVKIIDRWEAVSLDFTVANQKVFLQAGQYYPITVEYQQLPLYAAVFLFWEADGVPMSLVPESSCYVPTTVYNQYASPQYYNELERNGTGFKNVFHTGSGSGRQEYSEINSIDYDWGGSSPGSLEGDAFFGRMDGELEAKFTEPTTLYFTVDDGIKVWIQDDDGFIWLNGGEPVIDEWGWNNVETFRYTFDTVAGSKYRIHIEYADWGLGASCVMQWEGNSLELETVPREYMYPVD